MSYVIQNTFSSTYTLPITHRSKLMFTLRTLRISILLLKKSYLLWGNQWTSINKCFLLTVWTSQFFTKGLTRLLYVAARSPKLFHSYNLPKSLQFWIAEEAEYLIDNKFVFQTRLPSLTSHTTLRYVLPVPLSNISLHNKKYRQSLFLFLQLLLTNWSNLNRSVKVTSHFPFALKQYLLLRFHNIYYFKIFNF